MRQRFGWMTLAASRPEDAQAQAIGRHGLERAAAEQGVALDLSTLDVQIIERVRINGEAFLSDEEVAAGMTGEDVMVRASAEVSGSGEPTPPATSVS